MAATDISTQQMQLVSSGQFTNRLQYLLVQQAKIVLAEAHSTAFHPLRAIYANFVVKSPGPAALQAVVEIVGENIGGAVVVGTVFLDPLTNQFDSSASDTALTNAIVDLW